MTRMPECWRAVVLTLLPELFPGPLGASVPGRALARKLWALETLDLRRFARPAGRIGARVDSPPAGGGPGMVLRADVAGPALDAAKAAGARAPFIFLTPAGAPLRQKRVRELAQGPGATLLCGRFEGVDQRVIEAYELEEISVGDFVLAGGETAAMALIEAAVRLLPGVAGQAASLREESFEGGLLEYPHYTRPRQWRARAIPSVLTSGNHHEIARWRAAQARARTAARRPDLPRGAPPNAQNLAPAPDLCYQPPSGRRR